MVFLQAGPPTRTIMVAAMPNARSRQEAMLPSIVMRMQMLMAVCWPKMDENDDDDMTSVSILCFRFLFFMVWWSVAAVGSGMAAEQEWHGTLHGTISPHWTGLAWTLLDLHYVGDTYAGNFECA